MLIGESFCCSLKVGRDSAAYCYRQGRLEHRQKEVTEASTDANLGAGTRFCKAPWRRGRACKCVCCVPWQIRAEPPVSDVLFMPINGVCDKMTVAASDCESIEHIIEARFNFIYGDVHGVAYLLGPCYYGMGMDVATRQEVERFIGKWHGDAMMMMMYIVLRLGTLITFNL